MDYAARHQNAPQDLSEIVEVTGQPDPSGERAIPGHKTPIGGLHDDQNDRAPRYTLFIRAAKLITSQGEFVCIVRDVSETGVRLRLFHAPPTGEPFELHMTNGKAYLIRQIWHRDNEAGFAFVQRIDIEEFVAEDTRFPKRGMRLSLLFPVTVKTLQGEQEAIIENISQQGARLSCEGAYAIDQNVRIECPEEEIQFGEVSAKVRWRREDAYGVVFENTLSLEQFAKLAARLQCPGLLR